MCKAENNSQHNKSTVSVGKQQDKLPDVVRMSVYSSRILNNTMPHSKTSNPIHRRKSWKFYVNNI